MDDEDEANFRGRKRKNGRKRKEGRKSFDMLFLSSIISFAKATTDLSMIPSPWFFHHLSHPFFLLIFFHLFFLPFHSFLLLIQKKVEKSQEKRGEEVPSLVHSKMFIMIQSILGNLVLERGSIIMAIVHNVRSD